MRGAVNCWIGHTNKNKNEGIKYIKKEENLERKRSKTQQKQKCRLQFLYIDMHFSRVEHPLLCVDVGNRFSVLVNYWVQLSAIAARAQAAAATALVAATQKGVDAFDNEASFYLLISTLLIS